MPSADAREQLTHRLAEELGPATAAYLLQRLVQSGGQPVATLALLNELEQVSAKAARAAVEALPELDRRAGCSQVVSWLDLGVALAESSGATALKYFKDSPLILGVIERSDLQAAVLAIALEFAEQDANVTLEYLKAAPLILSRIPLEQVKPWLEIGVELTRVDLVVGLEYIRQIPALALVLPMTEVRSWLSFGMKLIVPNTLGKPDYLATMEFLRTGPAILGDIEEAPLRSKVVSLGTLLAEQAPEAGIAWLTESPTLLRALPSTEWRIKVLQYGSLLAEKDADAALSYLRGGSEIVGLIGDGFQAFSRFEDWFTAGMEVLAYSPEGARAYFAMESRKALASVEQALSGIPLRKVARKVKLFVQGLCGSEVSITALSDSVTGPMARARVAADGRPSRYRLCCGIFPLLIKINGSISSWPRMRPAIWSSVRISSSWGPSWISSKRYVCDMDVHRTRCRIRSLHCSVCILIPDWCTTSGLSWKTRAWSFCFRRSTRVSGGIWRSWRRKPSPLAIPLMV